MTGLWMIYTYFFVYLICVYCVLFPSKSVCVCMCVYVNSKVLLEEKVAS